MLIDNNSQTISAYDVLEQAFIAYKKEAEIKINTLKQEALTTIDTLEKRVEQYRQSYETLLHQLKDFMRHRFGSRSERFVDDDNKQLSLFPAEEPVVDADNKDQENSITVAAHTRVTNKKNKTTNYPRAVQIIPVSDEERQCVCGCQKAVIRYETKELWDYQPAIVRIIEQRREVVACQAGCEGSIKTAPAPLHVLPKVKATERLLAHIVVAKLHDRQPLYHLEKNHLDISRETMARWVIQLIEPLTPVFNLLIDELINYDIASVDATTLQVLREPGREATTKSYAYCMRGGAPNRSVILYGYNNAGHKQYVDEWFEGFKGYVHMDADSFFDVMTSDPLVKQSLCNAHARRKFEAVSKHSKKPGLAVEALRFYKKLYAIERRAKESCLTTEQRYTLRQKESKPIVIEFKEWLDTHYPLLLPASTIADAFRYSMNHWEGLARFLDDGRLEIDNNLTEQQIKPLVIARKNFMFATSIDGAKAICLHLGLIRTAIAHRLKPYEYYAALLRGIPHCVTVEDYEKLLPWNINIPESCKSQVV